MHQSVDGSDESKFIHSLNKDLLSFQDMLNTMQHVRDKIGETAEALLSLTLQWK